MTRSVLHVRFIGLSAMVLALAACGGVSGAGDGGQTGGSNGGGGGQTGSGGTTGAGGTTGVGGTTGSGGQGGAGGRGGGAGSSAGAGGGGGSAASGCSGCDTSTQYCSVTVGGPAGSPPSYQCLALPSACASNPTCACLQGKVGCGNICMQGDGGVTVTCQAP